jgi:hypothetical protein
METVWQRASICLIDTLVKIMRHLAEVIYLVGIFHQ